MRQPFSSLFATLLAVLPVVALPAAAQVSVNPGALDQFGAPSGAAPPSAAPPSANNPPAAKPSSGKPPVKHPPKPVAKSAAKPPPATTGSAAGNVTQPTPPVPPAVRLGPGVPPVVPPAPPPAAVLAPPVPQAPAHQSPPAEPVPVVAGAAGEAKPIDGGVRVTFGPGSADLNPETDAALRQIVYDTRDATGALFNVLAYAAGAPDDPSTPRRLALSRALAARSVLIAQGIPSTRIYVRALGANTGDGPPDRVDVMVNTPPSGPNAALPTPSLPTSLPPMPAP